MSVERQYRPVAGVKVCPQRRSQHARRIAAFGSAAARLLRSATPRKLRFFDGCVTAGINLSAVNMSM